MSAPALITLRDVEKSYAMGQDEVRALAGVSVEFEQGDYVAVMGPSGSGKSTLMNIVGCLDTPSAGSYRLNGREIANMEDDELAGIRNQEIGFVFQTFRQALADVGLADRAQHRPNEMSGGQRQRVAIARALVNRPSILLADEPTGNLDSKTGEEIMGLIDDLHSRGNTILLVTHEEELARRAARVVRLRDGQILSDTRNQACG